MAKTVRYVPTFRAPSEYERQVEEARRRAALAEALAQQQYEPMEGNAAPIPKAAPLVKALQGYLTAREGRKAREAAEEAKGMEADYAQRMLGRMQGGYTYQPDAELETQMAKRPEETLDQYTQRMQATPFVGRAAPIPEQTELGEVTRQSQYRRAPEEVLGMASTSLGTAALKDRPVMAQRLAQMLETPKEAEYGTTPQFDSEGRAFVVNKAGNVRYLDGVSKAPETTELQRNYEYAKGQGYTGSFDDFRKSGIARTTVDVRYGAPVSGVDAEGNPVFFQPNPTGGPPSIIQGVRPEGKAQTESQANAALYAERMAESEPVFESFAPPSYGSRAKESLPGNIGNVMLTPEARQWFQAERNFINAVLRKESGAVISDSEFDSARKQYIPQPGDDEKTKAQKRQARETAIRAIGAAAGANYKPAPINPPEGVTPQEWAVMTLDERRKFAR
jgi:hypothetical protein